MMVRQVRVLKATRMISTLVGQSGREYNLQKVLQRHPKKPKLSVYLTLSILEHLQEFRAKFKGHPRLRIYIDKIQKENILVYEYFKLDLLALVENYPPLLLIYVDSSDEFYLDRVVLGNIDYALKLKGEKLLNYKIRNCLYVITGVQLLHFDFMELNTEPEVVVLFKLLSTFGPLLDELIKHVDDANAKDVFPNLTDEAKRLILRITNLNPAKRATMSEIVKDSYWGEDNKS
ncbi:hypothetical protein COCVIDRAFT_38903 [Bipolaris victoriae FI3]|uniref:Protein kinase domain-containing protein n=1 Tax=Bipolaris victoriae (strain FI3) TaxID=930091 RepID=W7E5U8_BIPV3|nr:hypothetical protein COCVIDRAFT_38903 [Bipolaris victoriae FI3]